MVSLCIKDIQQCAITYCQGGVSQLHIHLHHPQFYTGGSVRVCGSSLVQPRIHPVSGSLGKILAQTYHCQTWSQDVLLYLCLRHTPHLSRGTYYENMVSWKVASHFVLKLDWRALPYFHGCTFLHERTGSLMLDRRLCFRNLTLLALLWGMLFLDEMWLWIFAFQTKPLESIELFLSRRFLKSTKVILFLFYPWTE